MWPTFYEPLNGKIIKYSWNYWRMLKNKNNWKIIIEIETIHKL